MEWKIYIAEIVIGILCAIQIVVHGDGDVLKMGIMAEGILGGVNLAQQALKDQKSDKPCSTLSPFLVI
jgi:hypothetical protein